MSETFRPDLSDYEWMAEILAERLNKDGAHKMTKTDVAKIALERMLEDFCPDVKVVKKRKMYVELKL